MSLLVMGSTEASIGEAGQGGRHNGNSSADKCQEPMDPLWSMDRDELIFGRVASNGVHESCQSGNVSGYDWTTEKPFSALSAVWKG